MSEFVIKLNTLIPIFTYEMEKQLSKLPVVIQCIDGNTRNKPGLPLARPQVSKPQAGQWCLLAHTAQACLCREFNGRKAAFPPQNSFMDLGRNLCQRFMAWSGKSLFYLKHKAWSCHVFPTIYLFKYWIPLWGVWFEQKNGMHRILKKTPLWTISFEC